MTKKLCPKDEVLLCKTCRTMLAHLLENTRSFPSYGRILSDWYNTNQDILQKCQCKGPAGGEALDSVGAI